MAFSIVGVVFSIATNRKKILQWHFIKEHLV